MNKISSKLILHLAAIHFFAIQVATSEAASFGDPGDSQLESSATVCMNVGAQASLSGFEDFQLLPTRGIDGAAGTLYEGSENFTLEANAPVRVLIDAGYLSNGQEEIGTIYTIDGNRDFFDSASTGLHSADHILVARAQLGRISQQPTGQYSSNVTLTVTPQIGGLSGCGQFSNSFNTLDGWATLAFEDPYPETGDGDYNDMVVKYHVQESYNANSELETISLQFEPLARGADYIHSLSLSLDGQIDKTINATAITQEAFVGDAMISVTYTTPNEGSHTLYGLDKEDDISIFNNTLAALDRYANVTDRSDWVEPKFTAQIDITLANPELNLFEDRGDSSLNWFRPYLSVKNTRYDIDLGTVNPDNGMIDTDGNPFGLLVPVSWEWPLEGVSISDAYPLYTEYTKYLSGESTEISSEAMEWYNYPADSSLIINLDR